MTYQDSILLAALQATDDDLPVALLPNSISSWASAWTPYIVVRNID